MNGLFPLARNADFRYTSARLLRRLQSIVIPAKAGIVTPAKAGV
jgi:hypothetical protein